MKFPPFSCVGRAFFILFLLGSMAPAFSKASIVSITQIVDHPALNAVKEGLKNYLIRQKEMERTVTFIEGNAQGNTSLSGQLALSHVARNPDVMVTLSTPSTQAALSATRGRIPIVFSAVTDVGSIGRSSSMLTGVVDLPPFERQLSFIETILPNVKKIAFLYNPGEDNAVTSLALFQKACQEKEIELLTLPISRASDIAQAIGTIQGKVQALYVPNDNTVVSAIGTVIQRATRQNLPVFAADIMLVEKGCIGMVGVDYEAIGQQTGQIVERILLGVSPKEIPVQKPCGLKLYINQIMAEKLGISLPKDLLQKADVVFAEK